MIFRSMFVAMQGILFALPESIRYPMDLVHLWLHESSRVYCDKLMEEKDVELFNKILMDTGKRYFEVCNDNGKICFFNRHKNSVRHIRECMVLFENNGSISSHHRAVQL